VTTRTITIAGQLTSHIDSASPLSARSSEKDAASPSAVVVAAAAAMAL